MNALDVFKEVRAGRASENDPGEVEERLPQLWRYYISLRNEYGPEIRFFDFLSYHLFFSTAPLTTACHLSLGSSLTACKMLSAHNRNRTLLALTEHSEAFLQIPALGKGNLVPVVADTITTALKFVGLPLHTISLTAHRPADVSEVLDAVEPWLFNGSRLLISTSPESIGILLDKQEKGIVRIECIKPERNEHGSFDLMAMLASMSPRTLEETGALAEKATSAEVRTIWNKLRDDQRFPTPKSLRLVGEFRLSTTTYRDQVSKLPYEDPSSKDGIVRAIDRLIAGDPLIRKTYCLEMTGARIWRGQVAINSGNSAVVHPFSFGVRLDDSTGYSSDSDFFSQIGQHGGPLPHQKDWDFLFAWRGTRRVIDRPAFWWTVTPHAYTHFVSEVWPLLEHLFRYCEETALPLSDVVIVLPKEVPGFVLEALDICGLNTSQIIHIDRDDNTIFSKLVIPSLTATNYGGRSPLYDAFWRRIKNTFSDTQELSSQELDLRPFCVAPDRDTEGALAVGDPGSRIFVSRLTDTHYRNLLNENELIRIAKARGYVALTTNGMSMRQKIHAFRQARVVVGPTGPGLFHGIFSGMAHVGILHSDTYNHPPSYLHHMVGVWDRHAFYCFGPGITAPNLFGWHGLIHGDFMIDPNDFVKLLDHLDDLDRGHGRATH